MSRQSHGRYYLDRTTPVCDEDVYERRIASYLAKPARLHPAIAEILAYEDATETGARRRCRPMPTPEWSTT